MEEEGAIQGRGTSAVMKHLLKSDEPVKGLGVGPPQECLD